MNIRELAREAREGWRDGTEKYAHRLGISTAEVSARRIEDVSSTFFLYLTRRTLRKRGAPEWAAYGGSILLASLRSISIRLARMERTTRKEAK